MQLNQFTCNDEGGQDDCSNPWWQLQPQSPDASEPSSISTPPMNLSTIEDWKTPHTTTADNNFIPTWSQGGFTSYHQSHLLHRHRAGWKKKMRTGKFFQKEGDCRSTSAKPADRLSLHERTFPDPLQTETFFTNIEMYVLSINWTYLVHWTRSGCVLRHFIPFSSNWYVSSTLHSSVLIQIRTELIRNKMNFYPSQCPYYSLL